MHIVQLALKSFAVYITLDHSSFAGCDATDGATACEFSGTMFELSQADQIFLLFFLVMRWSPMKKNCGIVEFAGIVAQSVASCGTGGSGFERA